MSESVYSFEAQTNRGETVSMQQYEGQVLLIVNTASACGFTPQYAGLQELFEKYQDQGLQVLAFPCNQFGEQEKGNDEEIRNFCDLQFNVSFPLFSKIDVNGPNTHPLYEYLKRKARGVLLSENIKWNFTKFLVGRDGSVIARYAPQTKPKDIEKDIKKALAA